MPKGGSLKVEWEGGEGSAQQSSGVTAREPLSAKGRWLRQQARGLARHPCNMDSLRSCYKMGTSG